MTASSAEGESVVLLHVRNGTVKAWSLLPPWITFDTWGVGRGRVIYALQGTDNYPPG